MQNAFDTPRCLSLLYVLRRCSVVVGSLFIAAPIYIVCGGSVLDPCLVINSMVNEYLYLSINLKCI